MVLTCPKCLKQWAHLQFEKDQYLYPVGAFCEACGIVKEGMPPGSILIWYGYGCNIDVALLETLPEALLKREFEIHLKEIGNGND